MSDAASKLEEVVANIEAIKEAGYDDDGPADTGDEPGFVEYDLDGDDDASEERSTSEEAISGGEEEAQEESVRVDLPAGYEGSTDEEASRIQQAMDAGWKPLDQYTGKPGQWRDYSAFLDYGEKYQGHLDDRSEIKELKSAIDDVTSYFQEQQRQTAERHKAELQAALKSAKEEMEVDRVEALTKEIAGLDTSEQKEPLTQQRQGEADFIAQFRVDNPMLNPKSSMYNQSIESAVEAEFNRAVQQQNIQTEEQAAKLLRAVYNRVANPTKPKTPPATRTPQKSQPKQKVKLDKMGQAIYDKIVKTAGKEAGKKFLQSQIGE